MLIHIVCWKYRDDVDEASRSHHRERLASLKGLVPGMPRLDIGEDVLHLNRSFDTALVAEFEDMGSLDAYTVHADHQVVVAIGREIADKVMSVDFYRSE